MKDANLPNYFQQLDLGFLKQTLSQVKSSTYLTSDKQKMRLFKFGDPSLEKLVLLPPYGMSFLLVCKLAACLSKHFYVLSWESKGCPDACVEMIQDDLKLSTQSRIFLDILQQEQFDKFHFVGWCQAAQLLIYTMFNSVLTPKTLSWIAPAGLGFSLLESEFERCALPIYLQIEQEGIEYAKKLAVVLDKYRDKKLTEDIAAEKLTMMHLSNVEMTYRFSNYMRSYESNKSIVKQHVQGVLKQKKVFIIHCKDDTYSHYSEAVQLEKQYRDHIQLCLLSEGGHLQLFNQAHQVADILFDYISDASNTRCIL